MDRGRRGADRQVGPLSARETGGRIGGPFEALLFGPGTAEGSCRWQVDLSEGSLAVYEELLPASEPRGRILISLGALRERLDASEYRSARQVVLAAVRDSIGFKFDWVVRDPQGAQRILEVEGRPIHSAGGTVVQVTGTAREVTEQRRTARFLQAAERIFAGADEGVAVLDSRFVVLAVNEAYLRATGYDRGESIGCRSVVVAAIESRKRLERAVLGALKASRNWQGELPISHKTLGPGRVRVFLRDVGKGGQVACRYVAVLSQIPAPSAAGAVPAAPPGVGAAARISRAATTPGTGE
jgi:PAS domain-containing protein